jgi:hypothetical protein
MGDILMKNVTALGAFALFVYTVVGLLLMAAHIVL